MKKDYLRTCICCGKEYEYCPRCGKYDQYPRWMTNFHDANCREIFQTTIEYMSHNITDDQTRARLDKCDLSNKGTFDHSVQVMLDKLYPQQPKIMPEPEASESEETEQLVRKKIKIKGGAERTVKE